MQVQLRDPARRKRISRSNHAAVFRKSGGVDIGIELGRDGGTGVRNLRIGKPGRNVQQVPTARSDRPERDRTGRRVTEGKAVRVPTAAFAEQREVGFVIAEEGVIEAQCCLDVVLYLVI